MNGKRILVTGKNSYIGVSVKKWLKDKKQYDCIDEVCVKNSAWQDLDFSVYDAVFHVAGLAHSDTGHATEQTKALYYEVNTHLTLEVAKKAKSEGVRQFIFMSSMIVYGDSSPLGIKKRITKETLPSPANFYGDSKLQAEIGLSDLEAENFKIAVIRPPMIYGKGSKGNYPKLATLAKKLRIFPHIENERSMLHIDNLCEFVHLIIKNEDRGTFHPQNKTYVTTSHLVAEIARIHGKKIYLTPFFNLFLKVVAKHGKTLNKMFGSLSYDMALSIYQEDYRVRTFEESIELTEK